MSKPSRPIVTPVQADPGPIPAPQSQPSGLEGELSLTPEDLTQFERNADDWIDDPSTLAPHLNRRLLVHLQLLDHITTHPPSGKTGIAVALTAHKEFRTVADLLIEAFAAVHEERQAYAKDSASRAPAPR